MKGNGVNCTLLTCAEVFGPDYVCDDFNNCTLNECHPLWGCQFPPRLNVTGQPCSDHSLCTANDQCDANGQCAGTPVCQAQLCYCCPPHGVFCGRSFANKIAMCAQHMFASRRRGAYLSQFPDCAQMTTLVSAVPWVAFVVANCLTTGTVNDTCSNGRCVGTPRACRSPNICLDGMCLSWQSDPVISSCCRVFR